MILDPLLDSLAELADRIRYGIPRMVGRTRCFEVLDAFEITPRFRR